MLNYRKQDRYLFLPLTAVDRREPVSAGAALAGAAILPNVSTQQDIINYYAGSRLDYQIYNHRLTDLSMHYGLWDQTTRTHREALVNENRVVADAAGITARDYVVDLGCGYGATAVWLASGIGCHVVGITLSRDQVTTAQELARKRNVVHLVKFLTMDYHRTTFPAKTFDAAIAIESIAHSAAKEQVLAEAYRILKPAGRLAIADGYFAKPKSAVTPHEWAIARACFEGVHVPPLPERTEFEHWLTAAGFSDVEWRDKTAAILPTAERVHRLGRFLKPLSRFLDHFGVGTLKPAHMEAFIDQYYAFRDGLGVYGIYTARRQIENTSGPAESTTRTATAELKLALT